MRNTKRVIPEPNNKQISKTTRLQPYQEITWLSHWKCGNNTQFPRYVFLSSKRTRKFYFTVFFGILRLSSVTEKSLTFPTCWTKFMKWNVRKLWKALDSFISYMIHSYFIISSNSSKFETVKQTISASAWNTSTVTQGKGRGRADVGLWGGWWRDIIWDVN